MDNLKFQQLLDANDMDSLLKNQGFDLTKRQSELVKQGGRENASEELLKRQMKQATEPGYADSVLMPVIRKILENNKSAPTQRDVVNELMKKGATKHEETTSDKKTTESLVKMGAITKQPQKSAKYLAGGTLTKKPKILVTPKRTFGEMTKNLFERMMGFNDDPVYVSKKIITFLKKKSKEDKDRYKESKIYLKEETSDGDRRHKEIMEIFIKATEKQKKVEKKMKSEVDKTKKKEKPEEKLEVSPKTTETVGKPTTPTTPAPTATPAKPPTPTSTPVTPTPTPPATPLPKVGLPTAAKSAAKVAVVAGLAGAITTVKAKIAGKESAGASSVSYNTMNLGPGEKMGKDNIFNLTEMTIPDVIKLAEERGKKFNKKGIGKAAGKYQFMPATLMEYAKKVFGDKWKETKYTADNQELLMDALTTDNAYRLKENNVPVSDLTLYAMHFTGSVNQARLIATSPDSTPMSSILTPQAQTANPTIAKMTVGEYKEWLKRGNFNLQEITIVPPQKEEVVPVSPQSSTGQLINNVSVGTNDMKRDMKQSGQSQVVVNNFTDVKTQRDVMVKPTSEPHPYLGQ